MIAPKSALDQLLLRGGKLTPAEVSALSSELTAAGFSDVRRYEAGESDDPGRLVTT